METCRSRQKCSARQRRCLENQGEPGGQQTAQKWKRPASSSKRLWRNMSSRRHGQQVKECHWSKPSPSFPMKTKAIVSEVGIGATDELSLRVSVAALVRVLFEHPDDGTLMLAIERK